TTASSSHSPVVLETVVPSSPLPTPASLSRTGTHLSGGINNSGAINTNGIINPRGIAAFTVDTLFGGISNFGTINSGFTGIAVDESTTFSQHRLGRWRRRHPCRCRLNVLERHHQ